MIDCLTNTALFTNNVKTRFAPSPTGHLHLGRLYAAKIAHDLARKHNGSYLLRFEDIDITRVKDEFYTSILEDLKFFGITHDQSPISQLDHDRVKAYEQTIYKLNELGVTYPCFCSRKEISRELATLANAPHTNDFNIQHYPGTCRDLTSKEIHSHLNEGKIPSIRLNSQKAKTLTGSLKFTDLIHGVIDVDHNILGDCILARRDIGTSYHIASVIDDAYQKITYVTRGEDLLESTHIHRVLQSLLNLPEPIYLHHPLVVNDDNERLAKRSQSTTIKELIALGHDKASLLKMIQNSLQK